ncbi:MAG: hypothetical protein Q4B68_07765 [Bacteroidales bacterium]|nr:hypothetical protein [Bacteroidales bacterium]
MKKIYVSILAAALTAMAGMAQDNLQKEITLPKDFVPVVKKATKKSALPRVLKPVKGAETSNIDYTDWAEPTAVSVEIPTMLPYGYRTGHRFSKERGYIDAGAGSQLNIVGSAGYRLVDDETLKVGAWLQHNSTWNGKNSNEAFSDVKQKFCDNVIGVDAEKTFGSGNLNIGAKVHFDRFNYYAQSYILEGAAPSRPLWWENDQNFLDMSLGGTWKGKVNVSRFHDVSYIVGFNYNYAGYKYGFNPASPLVYDGFKGAKEHHIQASLGAKYGIAANSTVGMDFKFDLQSRCHNEVTDRVLDVVEKVSDNTSMITIAPYYTYYGQNLLARLGLNMNVSFSDGAALRFAPNVQLAYEFTQGVSLYANAEGGKRINTLARVAAINRYLDPNGMYCNTFVPLDAEAGFKIGPFNGLTARAFFGYGIFKDNLESVDRAWDSGSGVMNFDCKGMKAGAEVKFKYRSVFDVKLAFTYAPQDDTMEAGKSYGGYALGLDHAKTVANADLNLYLFKGFTIGTGLEYRGGRRYFNRTNSAVSDELLYYVWDMNNVMNLHAGASYRFDKYLTLWVKADNLLNKQWDVLNGMGAQKLSVMGGIGFVF